jgi:PIN domain nuclease of toxin-antitoxin system
LGVVALQGFAFESGALDVVDAADVVWLSPISFFEIGRKVRLGKWPQMAPFANGLAALLEAQGGKSRRWEARLQREPPI